MRRRAHALRHLLSDGIETLLSGAARALALRYARSTGRRVTDQRLRERALARLAGRTTKPLVNVWRPAGLSMGGAGLALMCSVFDGSDPGDDWDRLAHELLTSGLGEARGPLSLSLFSGTVGYAAAVHWAGREGERYRDLLRVLDAALFPGMVAVARCVAGDDRPAPQHYDVVTGIAGWSGYLRGRAGVPEAREAAHAAADALVAAMCDTGLRRMSRPAGASPRSPSSVDCGLAHGLPGLLAALSLLELDFRFGRADVATGLRWAAEWVADRVLTGGGGVLLWPADVMLDERREPASSGPPVNAGSWCHGSSGVARALYLAGTALREARYHDLALRAFRTQCARPPMLYSPNLCHGIAGQLVITQTFAADCDDPLFRTAGEGLAGRLLGCHVPGSLLGYHDVEEPGTWVDHPGLSRGAAGVALALRAAADGGAPDWARLLLLC